MGTSSDTFGEVFVGLDRGVDRIEGEVNEEELVLVLDDPVGNFLSETICQMLAFGAVA